MCVTHLREVDEAGGVRLVLAVGVVEALLLPVSVEPALSESVYGRNRPSLDFAIKKACLL